MPRPSTCAPPPPAAAPRAPRTHPCRQAAPPRASRAASPRAPARRAAARRGPRARPPPPRARPPARARRQARLPRPRSLPLRRPRRRRRRPRRHPRARAREPRTAWARPRGRHAAPRRRAPCPRRGRGRRGDRGRAAPPPRLARWARPGAGAGGWTRHVRRCMQGRLGQGARPQTRRLPRPVPHLLRRLGALARAQQQARQLEQLAHGSAVGGVQPLQVEPQPRLGQHDLLCARGAAAPHVHVSCQLSIPRQVCPCGASLSTSLPRAVAPAAHPRACATPCRNATRSASVVMSSRMLLSGWKLQGRRTGSGGRGACGQESATLTRQGGSRSFGLPSAAMAYAALGPPPGHRCMSQERHSATSSKLGARKLSREITRG
jgi:hypothetical protein